MLGNFTNKSDVSATAMCTYGTLATGCGFEKRTTATATTEVHYIQAEGRTVAVHTSLSSTEDETRYLHGDHLGSVVLVTDEDGNVEGERYSFDAFGRRRNGSDWTDTLTALANPDTTLGYTGHESIDAVDIVHMNGRVYDPHLGRVLSPDLIVQAPHNGQSLNRYSYVMNNPLSYTDPSGYEWDWWGMDDDYCSVRCYVNSIFSGGFRRPRGGYGGGGSVAVVYYANDADADSEMDTGEFASPSDAYARFNGNLSLTHGWVDAGEAADVAADVFIPGYGLARCNWEGNCTVWDWGFGVLDIAVVATGVGYVGKVAVVGAVKAARGARQARNAATRLVCSFAAGTLVATPEGLKPIEDVHAGDWVLARDPDTGALEPKRVTFAYSSIHEDVLILTIRQPDGEEELIVTTSEHPFYVEGKAWVAAGELTVEDVLVTLTGETLSIGSIEFVAQARTAYNFEVADFHTYGVGDSQVWVHNACDYDFNKLHHIFGRAKHELDGLVEEFESQRAAFEAMQEAAENMVKSKGIAGGRYEETVRVGGQLLTVRGEVVDGVVRIGTAFIP